MDLTTVVYRTTKNFPKNEVFVLSQQIHRSAISVPSNIAEGAGRSSKPEFLRFLSISNGFINELETQLILAYKLGYMEESDLRQISSQITEVQKMNYALSQTLKRELNKNIRAKQSKV